MFLFNPGNLYLPSFLSDILNSNGRQGKTQNHFVQVFGYVLLYHSLVNCGKTNLGSINSPFKQSNSRYLFNQQLISHGDVASYRWGSAYPI